jgi:hypothetical protein
MSGRGGRGRFNHRGRGNNSSKPNSAKQESKKPTTKKTLEDYQYHLGNAKQAADFDTTNAYLINHIRETYSHGNDIALSLENLKLVDLSKEKPTLSRSREDDEDDREGENRQYEIMYKAELDLYMQQVRDLKENQTKAYSFLWKHCAKGMQNKIENRDDYKSIYLNPILLLKAIKEHALNYQEH